MRFVLAAAVSLTVVWLGAEVGRMSRAEDGRAAAAVAGCASRGPGFAAVRDVAGRVVCVPEAGYQPAE